MRNSSRQNKRKPKLWTSFSQVIWLRKCLNTRIQSQNCELFSKWEKRKEIFISIILIWATLIHSMEQDCLKTNQIKSLGSKLPTKSWKDDKEHVIRNGLIYLIKIRKMEKQLSNWRLSLISNARPTPSSWTWLKSESSKPTCRFRNYIQIYKKTLRSKPLSTWLLKSTSSTTKDGVL